MLFSFIPCFQTLYNSTIETDISDLLTEFSQDLDLLHPFIFSVPEYDSIDLYTGSPIMLKFEPVIYLDQESNLNQPDESPEH